MDISKATGSKRKTVQQLAGRGRQRDCVFREHGIHYFVRRDKSLQRWIYRLCVLKVINFAEIVLEIIGTNV